MFSLPDSLKRALNALAYDNIGNLGELRRRLEDSSQPAGQDASSTGQALGARRTVAGHGQLWLATQGHHKA
jgi:hypothetical protein